MRVDRGVGCLCDGLVGLVVRSFFVMLLILGGSCDYVSEGF